MTRVYVVNDVRKDDPYEVYPYVTFRVPTGENGDCWDRWRVRLLEVRESARIISQAIEGIPSGDLQAKVPKVIKVPQGETYVRAENPKGEMGYYLVSDGGQGPYRLKIRSASFSNISILPWIASHNFLSLRYLILVTSSASAMRCIRNIWRVSMMMRGECSMCIVKYSTRSIRRLNFLSAVRRRSLIMKMMLCAMI